MTARRSTRKAPSIDVDLDLDTNVELPDLPVAGEEIVTVDDVDAKPARKYMSHEHCGHARKGEAGKVARATCRRVHRAWFAAELEWFATDEGAAYLATGPDHPFVRAA